MWKKDEAQTDPPTTADTPRTTTSVRTSSGRAVIGPSITIRGDLTGSEDLVIQGNVDGSVDLGAHMISVGSEGRVNADIRGRVITIEGQVEGDLIAKEQIILRGSARVHGDIKAPRVVLEDGATFRGLVDMGGLEQGDRKDATKRAGSKDATKASEKTDKAEAKTEKAETKTDEAGVSGEKGSGAKAERPAANGATKPTTVTGSGERKGAEAGKEARA